MLRTKSTQPAKVHNQGQYYLIENMFCSFIFPWIWLCQFQLAGVVAVEVTGGPDISFVPGRKVIFSQQLITSYCQKAI